MKILALDTATEACSVALWIEGKVIERYEFAVREHANYLLMMVSAVLKEAALSLSQLDAIAFGRGPGSFTGLRIAASATQALSFAVDRPVIPISNLQAMAQGAYRALRAKKVLTAIDARMDEIYWGVFELADDNVMSALQTEGVFDPEKTIIPNGNQWIGVGSGWKSQGDKLKKHLGSCIENVIADYYPRARDIAELASNAWKKSQGVPAEQALPIYLRDKVTF